ncbi:hypothetical protein TRFO_36287 [Tritrichomonas foetus]|uniref:Uncharacterized protein n=1 Tax=Tritrichomonas foetus TaxID=1144522 RepID=A0A1J4JEB4_9EUKA|nr:hypothetical protein TRFO_36287 [Tritrichomonas foetus]|eukprot:OHS97498.1 hypothetical protein TRFO_36287 [Tritrichomonas foetus]
MNFYHIISPSYFSHPLEIIFFFTDQQMLNEKPKFDVLMIIFTISGLTALIGAIVEDVFLNDEFYRNVLNSLYGPACIFITIFHVFTMASGYAMHFLIPQRTPHIFIVTSIVGAIGLTASTMGVGILLRHQFESFFDLFLKRAEDRNYALDYAKFKAKYCAYSTSIDNTCYTESISYVWRRSGEAGITILSSFFVYLFSLAGLISHTCKSRKAEKLA